MDDRTLADILVFLVIAVLVTPVCHRLRVSPILGYLVSGFVIGGHGLALINDTDGVSLLAEMGVVFLLFMIGLELSLERIRIVRRFIFGIGVGQLLGTSVVLGMVAWLLGQTTGAAVIIGLSLAVSSTAFVLQVLAETGQLNTRAGRVALTTLILQDLAIVPLLVLIPLLGGNTGNLVAALGMALLRATGGLLVIFLVAHLALRPLFRFVAATHSTDAFVATVLFVTIGMSFATEQVGLSMSLGAFLAGIMLASTEYRHQVEADILPVRGLLVGMFFLTIGMTVDFRYVLQHPGELALSLAVLITVKTVILAALCRMFRFAPAVSFQIGLLLSQGGEFAFVTLSQAAGAGLIPATLSQHLVITIVGSMILTPLLAALGERLVHRHDLHEGERYSPGEEVNELDGHVIIAGFGRVGQTIASVLRRQQIPFVALDRNPHLVEKFRHRGEPVFFGSPLKLDVLRSVGAERARAAVLTMDNSLASEGVLIRLRQEYPSLHVLIRARDRRHQKQLELAGASGVVPETLEGSLQLAGTVLRVLGTPAEEIHGLLDTYRRNNYALVDEVIHPD
ncbi:MAG: monovalent cation:proton antiporter-2 (CPA2) family protein [Alphaproteobacteria bacterium]